MNFYIFLIFFFLLGLCVGSFLNVLILRLPKKKKISGRSRCPYCKKKLSFKELIPVLSFVFLGGKCSSCKKPISLQYPLVELFTGLSFSFLFWQFYQSFKAQSSSPILLTLDFLFWLIFASFLIVIFMTDLKFYIVPDKIIYPAIFFAILYQFLKVFALKNWQLKEVLKITSWQPFFISLFSGFCVSVFFLSLVILTKGKGMGLGDVKIGAFMGILLSYSNIIVALVLAFLSGSVVGLILIVLRKKTLKSEVPFGCFLAPATFVAFFWGQNLINFYWKLFL
jgi:prepilin signal peptidase PulO-like enzyme (type II secretory pathway)